MPVETGCASFRLKLARLSFLSFVSGGPPPWVAAGGTGLQAPWFSASKLGAQLLKRRGCSAVSL
ncbi:hypothetical protein hamaS1_21740 [Moorella sp. Hama-1]|nr:hypothetical protein hamaS1_21740 [Moorella sp. Hama-1]